jgi:hypothetical protein
MSESRAEFREELANLEQMAMGGLDMVAAAVERSI